jgi:hypothetical protein
MPTASGARRSAATPSRGAPRIEMHGGRLHAEAAFGRWLARTSCAQCYETSLRGDSIPDFTNPALQVVAAYSADASLRQLPTGVVPGGREPETMGARVRAHVSQLKESEIGAL